MANRYPFVDNFDDYHDIEWDADGLMAAWSSEDGR